MAFQDCEKVIADLLTRYLPFAWQYEPIRTSDYDYWITVSNISLIVARPSDTFKQQSFMHAINELYWISIALIMLQDYNATGLQKHLRTISYAVFYDKRIMYNYKNTLSRFFMTNDLCRMTKRLTLQQSFRMNKLCIRLKTHVPIVFYNDSMTALRN